MSTFLKRSLTYALFFMFLLAVTSFVFQAHAADDDFEVSAKVTYAISDNATARVTQNITLTNKKEFVYAPSYSITLKLSNIRDVSARDASGAIPFKVTEGQNDVKTIDVTFPEKIVGADKKNTFQLSFTTSDYVEKSGDVYSISVPATSNIQDFTEYSVIVDTPQSFAPPSIVKPDIPHDTRQNTYTFTKENIVNSGIFMEFGEEQYYNFVLRYHLENKNLFAVKTEIALPLNTSYQEVLVESILPKPENVYKDKDGNFLATYSVKPKTSFTVTVNTLIKTSIKPVSSDLDASLEKSYVRSQKYWDVSSPEIINAASDLKTPEDIYAYVVKTLSYSFDKISDKNERIGAKNVLEKPYFAVCLEFADLFVSLARAKGIPARVVEGYAFTENNSSRPVSLFEDVLHAWPEYYDKDTKTWIMVDPTWADTTGGVDYFHTFDLDHVAFVRNGLSSTYPVPAGGYKLDQSTKDVDVSFVSSSQFVKRNKATFTSSFSPFIRGGNIEGSITYYNNGNYETAPDNTYVYVDGMSNSTVQFPKAPPLGKSTVSLRLPLKKTSFLASLTNVNHTVTIIDENGKTLAKTTIRVFPFSLPFLIGGAILLGTVILLTITIKTRSLPFQK